MPGLNPDTNEMNSSFYKPHLDGVRALSILLVTVAHGGLGHIVPGGLGVTIFFFISGYLITALLLKEHQSEGRIDLMSFYLRRFWRLMPALLVYVIASMALTLAMGARVELIEPLTAVLYLSNYYSQFVGYEMLGAGYSPYNVLWSLAVEEHFYLFFAPLIALVRGRRALLSWLAALLLLPVLIRIGVTAWASADFSADYTYHVTDTRIDSIAWGCLLAVLGPWRPRGFKPELLLALGVAGLLISLLVRDTYFRQVVRYTLQGASLYLIMGGLIYGPEMENPRRLLANKALVFIGQISYSMYLYHWLALIVLMIYIGPPALTPLWQALYWAGTMVGACVSYYLIERPTLRLRVRYGSHVPTMTTAPLAPGRGLLTPR